MPELDWLLLAVAGLCCLGLVMAVSAAVMESEGGVAVAFRAHGTKLVAGLVAFVVCAATPLGLIKRLAWPVFAAAAGLVFMAAWFGPIWNGAQRWVRIGNLHFQPVEFARVALVLLTAALIARAGARIGGFRDGFVSVLVPVAVLAVGLALQPDLGSALLCCAVATGMALAAGVGLRWFVLAALPVAPLVVFAVTSRAYAMHRISAFLNEAPLQVRHSILAISSGGVMGTGIGDGWMKMGYVPEARSDFVFAVVGEELGLAGTLGVLMLYVWIGLVGYKLVQKLEDPFYRYVVFGGTMSICLQAAINLLVTTGMAPAKGIDLPFVSSGGTNLVATLAMVGLIGNAARSGLVSYRSGQFRSG